jgi:hypothetical protein
VGFDEGIAEMMASAGWCLGFVMGSGAWLAAASEPAPIAFLAEVRGEVSVGSARGAATRQGEVLDYLYAGEILRTGDKGQAVVVFVQGGLEEQLQPASSAVVLAAGLSVKSGRKAPRKNAVPLPAVAALGKMSQWVHDSNKFSGIVLRSAKPPLDADRAAQQQLRELCRTPAAQAADFLALAALSVQQQQLAEAIASLEKLLERSPECPRAHEALATLHNHLADESRLLDPATAAAHERKFLVHLQRAADLRKPR